MSVCALPSEMSVRKTSRLTHTNIRNLVGILKFQGGGGKGNSTTYEPTQNIEGDITCGESVMERSR